MDSSAEPQASPESSNLQRDESLEWEVLGGTRDVTGKFT